MSFLITSILEQASAEISTLRNENQIMSARLQMFDQMMMLFNTQPNYQQRGFSEDINYKIKKYLEEIKNEENASTNNEVQQ